MNQERATFAKWALVGAVAGIGLIGLNHAIGQDRRTVVKRSPTGIPPVTIEGQAVQAKFTDKWPSLRLKVDVSGSAARLTSKGAIVNIVQTDFKGSPMSRTIRPGDSERKVIATRPLAQMVGKTVDFGTAQEPEKGRRSYSAEIVLPKAKERATWPVAVISPPPIKFRPSA